MGFMDKIKGMASKNADKVNEGIEKAEDMVDDKTDGKFTGMVDKAGDAAKKAVGTDEA